MIQCNKSANWHSCYGKYANEVVTNEMQGIDILVDLSGHTANNRLDILMMKPARVQVSFLGYPATTGIPKEIINYRLVDTVTDPPGQTENDNTENLFRVEGSFLCYSPPRFLPEITDKTDGDVFVFGSFNRPIKISPQTLATWGSILAGCPNSRLYLKVKDKSHVQSMMDKEMLDRVKFLPYKTSLMHHLMDYNILDCCLDTFPYSGTTTTCESLVMGVPVVTLTGPTHRNNVSASILKASLMDESSVCFDVASYVQNATSFYLGGKVNIEERRKRRSTFLKSPFCDSQAYAKKIEASYLKMLRDT
jgi:predicted O-linked N-acetylglucosamine transferase (SPINDLY family)